MGMGIATPVSWNGNRNVVMGMGGNENSRFSHSITTAMFFAVLFFLMTIFLNAQISLLVNRCLMICS